MSRILAIDPGLANTGLVLFVDGCITDVQTVTTAGSGHHTDFTAAIDRSVEIAARVRAFATRHEADTAVVELYRDIPGPLRNAANRWTTPLLIGWLGSKLDDAGLPIVWQDPECVMRAYGGLMRAWSMPRRKRDSAIAGDRLLTNAHLRSAAAHGVAYLDNARRSAGTPEKVRA